jgi:hypothetical protein
VGRSVKTYLGDGAYADFDGFSVVLTTENGVAVTNRIVIEPEVLAAFLGWIERLKAEAKSRAAT